MHTNELAVRINKLVVQHIRTLTLHAAIVEDYINHHLTIKDLALKHHTNETSVSRAISRYLAKPEQNITLQQKQSGEWPLSFKINRFIGCKVLNSQTGIYYESMQEAADSHGISYVALRYQIARAKFNRSNFVLV